MLGNLHSSLISSKIENSRAKLLRAVKCCENLAQSKIYEGGSLSISPWIGDSKGIFVPVKRGNLMVKPGKSKSNSLILLDVALRFHPPQKKFVPHHFNGMKQCVNVLLDHGFWSVVNILQGPCRGKGLYNWMTPSLENDHWIILDWYGLIWIDILGFTI